jgi:hypothetical protein
VLVQLVSGDVGVVAEAHERHRHLAVHRIGLTDHRGLKHRGVGVDDGLDFLRAIHRTDPRPRHLHEFGDEPFALVLHLPGDRHQ